MYIVVDKASLNHLQLLIFIVLYFYYSLQNHTYTQTIIIRTVILIATIQNTLIRSVCSLLNYFIYFNIQQYFLTYPVLAYPFNFKDN